MKTSPYSETTHTHTYTYLVIYNCEHTHSNTHIRCNLSSLELYPLLAPQVKTLYISQASNSSAVQRKPSLFMFPCMTQFVRPATPLYVLKTHTQVLMKDDMWSADVDVPVRRFLKGEEKERANYLLVQMCSLNAHMQTHIDFRLRQSR